MEEPNKKVEQTLINGFSPVSSAPVFWKSRRRAVSVKYLDKPTENDADKPPETQENPTAEAMQEDSTPVVLSEKRKALFEPLEPMTNINGRRPSAEMLLPPPDFDAATYPKGWLIGKKRKLVNVDVVESMRRIAVQEMNRKDREIDGLNEQLEGDARCLEHLQLQLLEERSKRSEVERQNAMLQNQITMLMDMLQENDDVDDDEGGEEP
ncbi:protein HEADING DATE REPRESSOR 1 [Coffea eugenioides]|uniref:Protein HEADING DATE REPRESSOR 1 n=1 Tax=Coffea arabica TaxID=13443 RepID=A0A6P6XCL7_COFAR|nr:protein HEADING DATE REPRESSOR 1-like [Coffea arabica]XP_027167804.1 protein HEADING DATE REPRESSOR 1 [Coffea eugenioides]